MLTTEQKAAVIYFRNYKNHVVAGHRGHFDTILEILNRIENLNLSLDELENLAVSELRIRLVNRIVIHFISGSIFSSGADALVNPVNTVGVMGAGLAAQFKRRYPDMFQSYVAACRSNSLSVGKIHTFFVSDVWIVNFPTKEDWKNPSKLEWIDAGLQELSSWCLSNRISSVAIPALGCGLGGLVWKEVRSLIVKHFDPYSQITTLVYKR